MSNKNLRCDQAIRELAQSSASADHSAAVGRHLADCPECASWSKTNGEVLKVWLETTPVLPNEAKWEAVWTGLSAQLDQAELAVPQEVANTFTMRRLVAGRRRKLALAGFVLAQAALILLMIAPGIKEKALPRPSEPAVAVVTAARGDVVVETRRTILIQPNGESIKIVELAYEDPTTTIDTNYDLFNAFEAMAN